MRSAYLALWRARVEAVGTQYFPRRLLHPGHAQHLVLAVEMADDGQIRQVSVLHSSGDPALDHAALAILHKAEPFPPFPPKMKVRTQKLAFAYQWEFLPDTATNGEGP
jgi:protein TonB